MLNNTENSITIVSGIPRSGTSLVMQMLDAGGLTTYADDIRTPDVSNPRGYYETEKAKLLRTDTSWMTEANGKAVKIIHSLLKYLPDHFSYEVIFIERNLHEVVKSQSTMLQNLGRTGAALPPEKMISIFQKELDGIYDWLKSKPNIKVLFINYGELLSRKESEVQKIAKFLKKDLHVDAMTSSIDPALYRSKGHN
jgi:hypothetical protein